MRDCFNELLQEFFYWEDQYSFFGLFSCLKIKRLYVKIKYKPGLSTFSKWPPVLKIREVLAVRVKYGRPCYRALISILIVLPLLSSIGCSPQKSDDKILEAVFPVEVREAVSGVISLSMEESGEIIPGKQAIIIPKSAGMVTAVEFREGDRVAGGQVVFRLENTYQQLQLQQAKSVRQALKTELVEMERLLEAGAVPEFEVRKLKAELEQADISLKMAEYGYENTLVKAPMTGVLTELRVEEGELVGTNPVGRVMALDRVRVRIAVSENHIGRLSGGMAVKVDVPSAGVYREGQVVRIGKAAIPESRSFLVEVEVDNLSEDLRPGMFARVVVEADCRESLLVSATALYEKEGSSYLYVPRRGKAAIREVMIGARQDGMVEIIHGLSAGDRYIVRPPAGLRDGSPIEEVGGTGLQ